MVLGIYPTKTQGRHIGCGGNWLYGRHGYNRFPSEGVDEGPSLENSTPSYTLHRRLVLAHILQPNLDGIDVPGRQGPLS